MCLQLWQAVLALLILDFVDGPGVDGPGCGEPELSDGDGAGASRRMLLGSMPSHQFICAQVG